MAQRLGDRAFVKVHAKNEVTPCALHAPHNNKICILTVTVVAAAGCLCCCLAVQAAAGPAARPGAGLPGAAGAVHRRCTRCCVSTRGRARLHLLPVQAGCADWRRLQQGPGPVGSIQGSRCTGIGGAGGAGAAGEGHRTQYTQQCRRQRGSSSSRCWGRSSSSKGWRPAATGPGTVVRCQPGWGSAMSSGAEAVRHPLQPCSW